MECRIEKLCKRWNKFCDKRKPFDILRDYKLEIGISVSELMMRHQMCRNVPRRNKNYWNCLQNSMNSAKKFTTAYGIMCIVSCNAVKMTWPRTLNEQISMKNIM